jgi:hypothetical protein
VRARAWWRAERTGALGAALACTWVACASGPAPAPPPVPEWSEPRTRAVAALESLLASRPPAATGGLELRLAFAGDVDLDLYVTDPRLETLYYANTPVKSGGELLADQRCDTAQGDVPRVEVARFATPLPGRYRVGVDFPAHCGGGVRVAPFALSIESEHGRQLQRGLAEYLRFQTVVLEFEWPLHADESGARQGSDRHPRVPPSARDSGSAPGAMEQPLEPGLLALRRHLDGELLKGLVDVAFGD